jgi:hypothetical protein
LRPEQDPRRPYIPSTPSASREMWKALKMLARVVWEAWKDARRTAKERQRETKD